MPVEFQWIRSDAELAMHCQAWRELPFVVLDTEFVRVDTFYPKPGLLQVGDGQRAYLIDPLSIRDWSALAGLLVDPGIVKVLHACGEDLEVLGRLTGALPQPLMDTQLAAGFAGLGFGMGYGRLVQALLDVELPKGETRSDWLQRPLSEAQQGYAATDVLYLARIYPLLRERLPSEKWAWLLQDGADLVTAASRQTDPGELYKAAKLAWKLQPRQLAILRALYAWREEQARTRDRPRNHIVPEQCLWPLARFQPGDKAALARISDLPPRLLRLQGDQLLGVVAEAAVTPPESWPQRLAPPLPAQVNPLLKRLRRVAHQEAERQGMAPQLMLRKKTLEALLRTGFPDGAYSLPDELKGWRRELMGPALLDALAEPSVTLLPADDSV